MILVIILFGGFHQCGYPNSWMVSNEESYISLKTNGVQVAKFLDTSISYDLEENVSRVTAHDGDIIGKGNKKKGYVDIHRKHI